MEVERAASPLPRQKRQRQRQINPLPREMVSEVLLRLPAKPLTRFKALSKDWLSWISDPQFLTAHSHHYAAAQNNGYGLSLWKSESTFQLHTPGDKGPSVVSLDGNGIGMHPNYNHDYYCPDFSTILGSCNGLYFGFNDNTWNGFVWNPTTHKYLEIPPPRCIGWHDWEVCGLGYDSSTDDYKGVMAVFNGHAPFPSTSTSAYANIVSFKTRTWKQIDYDHLPPYIIPQSPTSMHRLRPAVLDGTPHWGVEYGDYAYNYCYAILYFDVENEQFKHFPSPPSVYIENGTHFQVETMGGKELCVFFLSYPGTIDVWAMKEYGVHDSWTKLFVIPGCWRGFRPLCFTPSLELLLCRIEKKLWSTDPKTFIAQVREIRLYDPKKGTDRKISAPPEIPFTDYLTLKQSREWIPTCSSSGDWIDITLDGTPQSINLSAS